MFEEKITKANEQIKKVIDYLKEHENAFQSMNLKLYDAFYYFMGNEMQEQFPLCYADNKGRNEYDDFYWFCDDSYSMFVEDLKESFGIDFSKMCHHIGRTSSFYLHDKNIIEIESSRYDNIDYGTTIDYFIDYYHNNWCGNYTKVIYTETINGNIDLSVTEEYFEETENELDYIVNDLYNDVVNYCKDIITVYEMIKDFKDNQVKYFKEYLEIQEEKLQEEKEEEENTRKSNFDSCVDIKNKYKISDDDMNTLKKCIMDYE